MSSESGAQTVAVLGASPKPDRYAYRAMQMLREHGHRAVPVNPAFEEVLGEHCYDKIGDVPTPIDTVTLYLGKARSDPLIDEILSAQPRRIIMNPGRKSRVSAQGGSRRDRRGRGLHARDAADRRVLTWRDGLCPVLNTTAE